MSGRKKSIITVIIIKTRYIILSYTKYNIVGQESEKQPKRNFFGKGEIQFEKKNLFLFVQDRLKFAMSFESEKNKC